MLKINIFKVKKSHCIICVASIIVSHSNYAPQDLHKNVWWKTDFVHAFTWKLSSYWREIRFPTFSTHTTQMKVGGSGVRYRFSSVSVINFRFTQLTLKENETWKRVVSPVQFPNVKNVLISTLQNFIKKSEIWSPDLDNYIKWTITFWKHAVKISFSRNRKIIRL